MSEFNTSTDQGLITDTFSTQEPSTEAVDNPPVGSSPEPQAPARPSIESPVGGEAENLRQQLEADYRRKTQALADQRRLVEQQQAEIEARRSAFEAERQALDPYRQFDAVVAADPVLQQVVRERVGEFKPGQAQGVDQNAKLMADMQSSMQQMVVSNAEQYLMQKYPDYADNRALVAQQMDDLGVRYPGHDIVKVTKQLEAAYKLATQGRQVEQVRQATEADTAKKLAATRVGAGAPLGTPSPEPEVSMRRPDGRLKSYDEIGSELEGTMRRR